jgi:hypothetical protein
MAAGMTCNDIEQRARQWAREVASPTEVTLILENVPTDWNKGDMLNWLDSTGFDRTFDFFYIPRCFKTRATKGCAFINFYSPEYAKQFKMEMTGAKVDDRSTPLRVSRACNQGLEANMSTWLTTRTRRVRDPEVLPYVRPLQELGLKHPIEAGRLQPRSGKTPKPNSAKSLQPPKRSEAKMNCIDYIGLCRSDESTDGESAVGSNSRTSSGGRCGRQLSGQSGASAGWASPPRDSFAEHDFLHIGNVKFEVLHRFLV